MGALLTAPPPPPPLPKTAQDLRPGISPADPARMLMIGDSLADGFGMLLVRRAAARGLPATVTNRGRVSTGLSRADFYDWPARFAAMADQLDPDVVVAHFGANDMQGVIAPEGRTPYGSEDWEAAYRAQIRKILKVAAERDIVLYWIGPGPDGNRGLNAHLARINPWIAEEAERAGAVYFPITPFTAPPDGRFARTVNVGGRAMAMRTSDGSHFTIGGYELVADRILDALTDRFEQLRPATYAQDDGQPASRFALAILQ
ncbi:DUF459 domain-containing protein [uncultured Roseovarius sp.]|uniref:SGNH/GDSL hydrolase family protein n=1 Tax=uncultured Roseovarius sp. TaxID=293344 RepID=UPI00262A71A8|nr:DUF459 domain-containing protein [uncultured Roseovarius sp.]